MADRFITIETLPGRDYSRLVVRDGGPLPIRFYNRERAQRVADFLERELHEEMAEAAVRVDAMFRPPPA